MAKDEETYRRKEKKEIMYCSLRNCYKEAVNEEDNWSGLCLEHYQELQRRLKKQNDDFQDKLKHNLEKLKEVNERIEARKSK
jgi:uncharacterized protein YukE